MGKGARTAVTIIMDALILIALLLAARLIIVFFGQLASQDWGKAIVQLAGYVTIPLGLDSYHNQYGGSFDVNAGISMLIVLLAEWMLSAVRNRD